MNKFSELELSQGVKEALDDLGYIEMTEVQSRAIPLIMSGRNAVVKSYTGSGKTAAFAVPLIEKLLQHEIKKVLVLGPTRELVVQVKEEMRNIGKNTKLRILAVYGGHGIEGEIDALQRGVDVLCATPGRLLDHIDRKTVHPEEFDVVVLDEADRMLDMGFVDDIKNVLDKVMPNNVHLFSATLDGKVADMVRQYIPSYEKIFIEDEIIGKNIIEKHVLVSREQKFRELVNYIREARNERVLIFVSTKKYADVLTERLVKRRFRAACIHGDLSQTKREHALNAFKQGKINILIATDVAARGLQIDDVEYVINYDKANDADTHKHRIGRTGRMGSKGYAITFVESGNGKHIRSPREMHSIQYHLERGY
ncbi:MAG: DEAD/DEAH box helicase [Candidatus Micrarchaeia archaeon]